MALSRSTPFEHVKLFVVVFAATASALAVVFYLAEPIGYLAAKGRLRALREQVPSQAEVDRYQEPGRQVAALVMPCVVGISTETVVPLPLPEDGTGDGQGADAPPASADVPRDPFLPQASPEGEPNAPADKPDAPADDGEPAPSAADPPDTDAVETPSLVREGVGSGFIFDAEAGHVLTNAHVVEGARTVRVRLPDGRETTGQVLGADRDTDLAVVKIELGELHALPWGDSQSMAPGDEVFAAGSPFGLDGSLSRGIISAVNRPRSSDDSEAADTFLQTDALITPGSSGGPLVNLRGEVIGINTAMASYDGQFAGVGFAVPADRAKQLVGDLIAGGPGQLGVLVGSVADWRSDALQAGYTGDSGALVFEVFKDLAAEQAGVLADDVIVAFDTAEVDSMDKLGQLVASHAAGAEIVLRVWRSGEYLDLPVTLSRRYAPQ